MEVAQDEQEIIARVAALDIGKAEVVCCVRVPEKGGSRLQEVRTFNTMTPSLLVLSDWLEELGCDASRDGGDQRLLEAAVLPAGEHVSDLTGERQGRQTPPGEAQTDRLDAVWLCKVAERQMLRASFVPPAPFRELRDLTRYRVDLITARTAEKQRVEKLLHLRVRQRPGG